MIRRRFPENVTNRLAQLAWWDWNHEALRRALPDFRRLSVEDFLAKYERASVPTRPLTPRRSAAS